MRCSLVVSLTQGKSDCSGYLFVRQSLSTTRLQIGFSRLIHLASLLFHHPLADGYSSGFVSIIFRGSGTPPYVQRIKTWESYRTSIMSPGNPLIKYQPSISRLLFEQCRPDFVTKSGIDYFQSCFILSYLEREVLFHFCISKYQ